MPLNDDSWRTDLHAACEAFAPLYMQDITLDIHYGIAGGAILWSAREAPFNEAHKNRLNVAQQPDHLTHLLQAVGGWDVLDPLTAARTLSKRVKDNAELCAALDALLHCLDELVQYGMLKQDVFAAMSIAIVGGVSGANIVIGGYQYVAGDLIVQYLQPKAERQCPKPLSPPAHFGGREEALKKLKGKLKAGEKIALTALNGVGGVGKTTLAKQLAHEMFHEKVFRAVLWADVTRAPNAVGILREWAVSYADSSFSTDYLKGEQQIAAAVKGLLDDVIGEKCELCEPPRVLVVLDDVWDNGLEAVRLLQVACPDHATVLITTRSEKLANNLHAEAEPLTYLTADEATAMLQSYLPTAEVVPLRELGEALGGHALALELAARRIDNEKNRPGQTLATALDRCTKEYQKGIPAGTPFADLKLDVGEKREDNLTAALALSYNDLAQEDQGRFRALGAIAYDAPFDQMILGAVWNVPLDQVDDLADALRLLSLLQTNTASGGYRLHPLLWAYARALLNEAGEAEMAFTRYADLGITVASAFRTLQPERWGRLAPYLPHIHAIGNELVEQMKTPSPTGRREALLRRAQAFAINTSYYLARRREVHQVDWSEMGLAASKALHDIRNEAYFLNDLGLVYAALGDKRRALEYYQQALPLHRAMGDRSGEAVMLNNIGLVYDTLGDKQRALEYYQQALPLRRAIGDRGGEAVTLNNIGLVYDALGDKQRALEYYRQALPIHRAVGDRGEEAVVLNNIGGAYDDLGDKRQALEYYQQALPILQAMGDKSREAVALNNIGGAYDDLGDKRRALDYYEQALPIRRSLEDRGGEAITLNNIAMIYFHNGDLPRAAETFRTIIVITREIAAVAEEAAFSVNLASVVQRMGRTDEAIALMQQSIDRLKQYGLPRDAVGMTIAQHEQILARLWGKLQPLLDEGQAFARQMTALYQQGGAEAVRALLKQAGMPDELIEAVLIRLTGAD